MSERVYFSSTVRHPELQHFGGQEGQEHQGKPILMSGITLSLSPLSLTHTHIHTNHLFRTFPSLSLLYMWKSVLCACMRFPVGRPGPNCRTALHFCRSAEFTISVHFVLVGLGLNPRTCALGSSAFNRQFFFAANGNWAQNDVDSN
jgi:hypothetical protein